MNPDILQTDVQQFINDNLNEEVSKLILKGSPFQGISIQELANQIQAKQKCSKKLPTWFATENIYYPEKISIEQTSSEITALYKSKLVKGKNLIDISGGFGVDAYFFSKLFEEVTHCEINIELSQIVAYNLNKLHVKNMKTIDQNGIDYIKNQTSTFDCIYTDPARRDQNKNKVFLLSDCTPNIPKHLETLFEKTETVLIKTSPLLDISLALKELQNVKEVHIVAINNEVKELLFLLEKNHIASVNVKTVNFKKDTVQKFDFILFEEKNEVNYSMPKKYLYEPNAAILKSGGFNEISRQLNISKLHQHTHLYTSDELIEFPGRTFEIEKVLPYNKKRIAKEVPKKANITTRNFPKTVAQIRKETKISDGGSSYIFFTKLLDDSKVLIVNNKVN
ncbi:THUMP-like domain-containing protein [Tenacibaculum agarivorans]|uniref:THUMP-like domain-containing protein n=1 Tax=Tenacibaculum agarivorans TaxID=1908389 RepID=UPI00094B8783|nr:SAM-dependent methyltransferase [Tenacibaculum agarivorans]